MDGLLPKFRNAIMEDSRRPDQPSRIPKKPANPDRCTGGRGQSSGIRSKLRRSTHSATTSASSPSQRKTSLIRSVVDQSTSSLSEVLFCRRFASTFSICCGVMRTAGPGQTKFRLTHGSSAQATRVIIVAPEELSDPQKVEAVLRKRA